MNLAPTYKKNMAICLIGNGPSASQAKIDLSGDTFLIARSNFFWKERDRRFGNDVHFYFWCLNNPVLHTQLSRQLAIKNYNIMTLFSPVSMDTLRFSAESADSQFLLNKPVHDHWRFISRNPYLARYLMSRPLPTTGLQMLATLVIAGFRKFLMIGFDFYYGSQRYMYEPDESMLTYMDPKHFKPGYESGAHSLDLDVSFFYEILNQYPDIDIINGSKSEIIDDILNKRRPQRTFFANIDWDLRVR